MDKPNDKRKPERPPPIISDAEVDRLLNQAQSLTDEIIAEVGVNAIEDREAAPQLGGPEPEPNSAVDLVSHDLAELKETIEEVSPEIQQALLDALAESDAAEPAMEPAGEAGVEEGEIPEAGVQDHAGEDSPRISAEMEAALQAALAEDAASPPAAVAQGADSAATEAIAETDAESQTEVAAEALQPAVPAVSKEAAPAPAEAEESRPRRMLVSAALIVPNAILKTIELLDRPFSRIPSGAKNAMGAAGMASLLMGVAAFFMPKLMQSNPYATMEPLPHPVVVEGPGEHESGHNEKPAGEHEAEPVKEHEEKPAEHGGGHH